MVAVVRWASCLGVLLVGWGCGTPPVELTLEPRAFVDEAGNTVWGEFGYLEVPEWHERPAGGSIQLAVARFSARTDAPGPPIIYLEGGPGAPGIHPERLPLLERLREHGDVITFDQRGTGASRPELHCGRAIDLSADESRTYETWLAAEKREASRCAQELKARGVDLAAYNVIQSAKDVNAIRTALGADRIRLVGISFGSHLGLVTMKRYARYIDRAVLAGVEGLDQTIKLPSSLDAHLSTVSQLISADYMAGKILPDFEGLVRGVLRELDEEPREVELNGSSVLLTAFNFRSLVAGSIVRRRFLSHVLEEYGPILEGDYRPIASLAVSNRVSPFGMRAAMDCASGASPERWARVQAERRSTLLQGVVDFPFPEVCEAWGVDSLGDEVWDAFTFRGPVLFITGTLDGLTPISNVDELLPYFPVSGHLIIEQMGHEGPGLWFASPDVLQLVGRFLDGAIPSHSTVSAGPIDWVAPGSSPDV